MNKKPKLGVQRTCRNFGEWKNTNTGEYLYTCQVGVWDDNTCTPKCAAQFKKMPEFPKSVDVPGGCLVLLLVLGGAVYTLASVIGL